MCGWIWASELSVIFIYRNIRQHVHFTLAKMKLKQMPCQGTQESSAKTVHQLVFLITDGLQIQ